MGQKPLTFRSDEALVAFVKVTALTRVVAILACLGLWYGVAMLLLVLHAAGHLDLGRVGTFGQVATAAGLTPLVAAALTFRAAEYAISTYVNGYARRRIER